MTNFILRFILLYYTQCISITILVIYDMTGALHSILCVCVCVYIYIYIYVCVYVYILPQFNVYILHIFYDCFHICGFMESENKQ
jgi:hypothetical protein